MSPEILPGMFYARTGPQRGCRRQPCLQALPSASLSSVKKGITMDVTVMDMMQARDLRAMRQKELLQQYGQTLLCFTMNIPGPVKTSSLILEGAALGRRLLSRAFLREGIVPVYHLDTDAPTGPESFYVLPLPALQVKRMCADIEEYSALGRLFDMDVLTPEGRKVERQELGLPGRSCLLCSRDAQACARSRTHTVPQLQQRTRELLQTAVREELCQTLARLACQSLLDEVLTTPKPGLVDRANSGSHRDMDVFTFSASISALHPYFARCAGIGWDTAQEDPAKTFSLLRGPGRLAEGLMLEATDGINTHRGAIFSMGILCAAAGRLPRSRWKAEPLLSTCAAMTRGLTRRDLGDAPEGTPTFAQALYLSTGNPGPRGEAEQGFPHVRDDGYPAFRRALQEGRSLNDAGCVALLALMARNPDTNLVRRGGQELLARVQACSLKLLSGDFPSDMRALSAFDQDMIRLNLSPGGSADLLSLCFMLYFLEEESK